MPPERNKRAGVALLIGIDRYLHAEQIPSLRFASRDAQAMARVLADPDICGFPQENVVLLTGEEAARDAIVRQLSKELPAAAQGAEVVVFYFAGHGMVQRVGVREEGFLLPHDADPEDLMTRGVAMGDIDRWIAGIGAALIVCLDCCHAGKIITRSTRSTARNLEFHPTVLHEIAASGRFVLASCDAGQKSLESPELEHGLFTYHLLERVKGAADRDGNGKVGVAELFEYVAETVERDAREKFSRIQKPWHNSIGPGGVFISAPKNVPRTERLWEAEGTVTAVQEIEQRLPDADESFLMSALRLLERRQDPAGILVIFRCLTHTSISVREYAKRAMQALGWERTIAAIEELARCPDEERMGVILDGLAAFEAHPRVVGLLDRLVVLVKGSLRNRTIFLLERKRLGIELERVSALFCEKNSPYQIQKVLGQGLFTAAYLAHHQFGDFQVVVRVLRPEFADQPRIRAQFLDLVKRSFQFVHQNLVVTREAMAFPEQNLYYAVRDYIDGVTLQKLLESGKRFLPLQVIKILHEILDALTPLHRCGVFHGGIKPSNVFLRSDDRVVLGDPSLSVQGIGVHFDRLSYDYRYAPPEMFRSSGSVGPRSDFYALGCVAYELFCGEPPFSSDNYFELATKHDREAAAPLSQRARGLGAAGDGFIQRLLAKTADGRFGSLEEVILALDALRKSLQPDAAPDLPAVRLLAQRSMLRFQAGQSMLSFGRIDEALSPEHPAHVGSPQHVPASAPPVARKGGGLRPGSLTGEYPPGERNRVRHAGIHGAGGLAGHNQPAERPIQLGDDLH
jgi:serine/threonine protein kinase